MVSEEQMQNNSRIGTWGKGKAEVRVRFTVDCGCMTWKGGWCVRKDVGRCSTREQQTEKSVQHSGEAIPDQASHFY